MRARRIVLLVVLLAVVLPSLTAQTNSLEAEIKAAVDDYLAKVPPAQRARSDAYFEGGYWLLLVDFIYTIVVMRVLLRTRWSARMRNFAGRITRSRFLQPAAYWIQFIVVVSLLAFPLTVYEAYYREHKCGLLNQTFGPWLPEQFIMLAVTSFSASFS